MSPAAGRDADRRTRAHKGAPAIAALALLLLLAPGARGASAPADRGATAGERARQAPFVVRPFRPFAHGRWIGEAIAYGPHRDGQWPNGPSPTRAQVREDLRLMARHWHLTRTYGSVGPADSILQVIRADRIPMKVVLGVWIEPEERTDSTGRVIETLAEAQAANRREIEGAVRLAARYRDIVVALCVGNETQVSWSSHRVPAPLFVARVREVRARVAQPVTTADDFSYWKEPGSRAIADELDFVVAHIHPLWNGRSLEEAVPWTVERYRELCALHPGRTVVIGETGWATSRLDTGDQGRYMKSPADEGRQATFCRAFAAWARRERVVTFFFEAFDENWKGGSDPADAEKHWGFYRADRTPKPVLQGTD
jgi:exo-beta-1,3-glucanase (GH17 family)